MSPQWLARKEPFILLTLTGHDKVPMFLWGPAHGPGVAKKNHGSSAARHLSLFATQLYIFFFTGLDPDGCLLADQLKVISKIT
jgi:hypothetical protein